ncbi:uncharacterized protein LOC132799731 [Ziziphus jujuba]|uniref:Uncharacterized protein LOC132799731 n=1 Tax=Ziziphus jujuba TaxID=326968 RepID=A0ABM3ZUL6_ZIZJJ|nr:uncharacterized protein LOC132799731 [Ziziphus jujuba]
MDNQQISSSSLDGQQEDIPQPYDESWFDLTNSCGKEFELPNVFDPMSLDLSINSNNLLVSPFQRLDIPCVLDDTFVLEITGPSSAGNQLVSLPPIEMVPSVTNTSSAIDQQGGSLNSRKDSSVEYSFSVPIACFLSSGSSIISNEEVGDPVTSYRLGFSANGFEHDGSEYLPNSNSRIGITSNLSILMKKQEASPTHAPLSNVCGSDSNEHNFGTSSLQVCQPLSYNGEVSYFSHMSRINGELKYICKDCQKEFSNYNAFGGHMSCHAKASKMIKKFSGPTNPSQKHKKIFSLTS